ncbi:hypothetical protein MSAN_00265300 [Mycena sanguinolenta]|uniref:Glycan binding protein Y3-like domain-containing protein n=1 Tax=Mycena sanguinolenta TaxID=230812 RepID=A0A8H7DN20_9AGAR|nr:hypothetical protein MSAN_00265300 [Mycena sanguinolenta]
MLFKPRTHLLGLVLFAVSTIHAQTDDLTCFDHRASLDCSSFISNFCSSVNPDTVGPDNTISWCFNGPLAGKSCIFKAVNTVSTSGSPGEPACNTALNDVTATCPKGGSGQLSGHPFKFTLTPSNEPC